MPLTMDSPERFWRTQFDKQLTDETTEQLLKQTTAMIRYIEQRTGWRDHLTPDDRLHTAIAKLLDGSLRWDPARVDLAGLILGAINGEISHEARHAKRFKYASLDDEQHDSDALDQAIGESVLVDREAKCEVPKDVWWPEALAQLRKHAKGDRGVLAIVDAYENGKVTRREVTEFAGMSVRQYHAAYQRLMRVAQKIDDDVLAIIMKAIA